MGGSSKAPDNSAQIAENNRLKEENAALARKQKDEMDAKKRNKQSSIQSLMGESTLSASLEEKLG